MATKTDQRFPKFDTGIHQAAGEETILKFWAEKNIFERTTSERPEAESFVFYEGPPTTNGRPGVHHVLSRTVKDLVCRFWTMQGYRVNRKGGWDTHGLPVEIEVEKQLGISGKPEIEKYGVAEFNARCRSSVFKYREEWNKITERIGFWLDLENPYITLENDYIETVWYLLKRFWDKGLVYAGFKVLPYCPRCGTALSDHEVSQGYKEVTEPSIYAKFKVKGQEDTFILAWTTTPWTLPGNVALAVGDDIDYVKVKQENEFYYLAKARVEILEGEYEVVETVKGRDLVGTEYEPLLAGLDIAALTGQKAYFVAAADFVTTEDGTGVVHTAVMYGADDYALGETLGLPKFHTVNERGHFTDDVPEFAGLHVKEADVPIIKHFKIANRLYKKENYTHNYPFCWRCDSALIYYARDSWYLETTKLREDMIRENEKIQWFPAAVGENRFGNWLKGNIDWAISRDRYWGTPMPIWECEGCDEKVCIGSREELRERGGNFEDDLDLHRPAVDEVTLSCSSCSGQMNRVKSVVDVWFDSGSMPFAQWHYPFENKDRFGDLFPANFICEGIDQSRGWFYSLLAIGVMETGKSPYKAVLSNELVLDEQGRKMSKRLGNAADPWEILEKEGADALRWYLIANSPPWVPTKFARHGVTESARKIFGTLRNVASFFVTYANVDEWTPAVASPDVSERPDLDRWILSRLDAVAAETRQHLLDYQVTRAARTLSTYIQDELSNWYVRRNRRRFWKGERGDDKNAAYATLHEVLVTLAKLMAPITPFISEQLYQTLVTPFDGDAQDSVHLTAYPNPDESRRDTQLEKTMGLTLAVTEAARAARTAAGIKVRQPLGKLWVLDTEASELPLPMQEIVKEEINVKEIGFQAADQVRSVSLKPNFPALGPRFGGKVNNVAKAIKGLDDAAVKAGLKEKSWNVDIPEIGVEKITGAEATVQESPQEGFVLGGDSTQVALESALTPALEEEGFVRELVHGFQSIRKDKGLEITDRVRVFIGADEAWQAAFERHRSFIEAEVLASELRIGEPTEGDPWTLDDVKLHVSLEREGS